MYRTNQKGAPPDDPYTRFDNSSSILEETVILPPRDRKKSSSPEREELTLSSRRKGNLLVALFADDFAVPPVVRLAEKHRVDNPAALLFHGEEIALREKPTRS